VFARTKEEEIEQVEGALAALTTSESLELSDRAFVLVLRRNPGAVTLRGLFFGLVPHVCPRV